MAKRMEIEMLRIPKDFLEKLKILWYTLDRKRWIESEKANPEKSGGAKSCALEIRDVEERQTAEDSKI